MTGGRGRTEYPSPLNLNYSELPWVSTAVHLGHDMNENCNMEEHVR